MKTIKSDVTHEITVEKSKFICYLRRVKDMDEVNEHLSSIKKHHYDASHHVSALILNNTMRSTDDGEPQGTAGMPILNVLINNDLNEVLAVVVRYFGGVKLGTGGLARAYSDVVVEAMHNTTMLLIEEMDEVKITVDYHYGNFLINKLAYILENKYFGEKVELFYLVDPEETDQFLDLVKDLTNNLFEHEILGTKLYEREE